ncbi:hypothetical protein [Fusobacterium massiliense]|uniref:hypothetical protein n=1 Tax=Fusobacterium massiliense TaxID=1852365 RepID=UPI0028CFDB12|nr:hypothetical protein [Fusobacterium massiliense]
MSNNKKILTILALFISSTIYSEDFVISKAEKKEKIEKLKKDSINSGIIGIFAKSGNAVVFQRNGKILNKGKIQGKVIFEAEDDTKNDKTRIGEVISTSQGNGVSGVGYSPYSNKNGVSKKIEKLENEGHISGTVNLIAGNTPTFGGIEEVYSSGNGVSGLSLVDFGETATGASVDSGKVDGIGGASSRGRASFRSVSTAKLLSSGNTEKSPIDKKVDEADIYGKNNKFAIENVRNNGQIKGKSVLKTKDGYIKPDSIAFGENKAMSPQWRTINSTATGNGISNMVYLTTIDKYTWSDDKENIASIGNIENNGHISGNVDASTGNFATLNNIRALATGNGVSSTAYSNQPVKATTKSTLGNIKNNGEISGKLSAVVGKNTSRGIHEYSNADIKGSANGISIYTYANNNQVKETESSIGEVENTGKIVGDLYAKAGTGYGELKADVVSSGNGIAVYNSSNSKRKTRIESINNKGSIVGKAIVYGGKSYDSTQDNDLKEKRFHIDIEDKDAISKESNFAKSLRSQKDELEFLKNENSEWKKYENEKENEKANKIKELEENILKISNQIIDKSPKNSVSIAESEKDKFNKVFIKYVKEEIDEQQNLIDSGISTEVTNTAKKRKEELGKMKNNKSISLNEQKIYLEKYRSKLEEANKLEKTYWKRQAKEREIKKIEDTLKLVKEEKVEDTPEIIALKEEKAKLEKELEKKLAESKKVDHIKANIHTEGDIIATGNGISIKGTRNDNQKDNDASSNKIGSFLNEGTLSGYAELYHGHSQGKYSRFNYQNTGAGLSVEGNVETEIKNTGIISGSEFALLSKGLVDDSQSIANPNFVSGFKGGVKNYGILAGRIIIGGYKGGIGTFDYFETIYEDKKHYTNDGIFVILDRKGEARKVIGENKKTKYDGKTIENILSLDGSYEESGNIENKIINGVGNNGLIKINNEEDKSIKNTTINAFKTAIAFDKAGVVKVENSIVNTNGFGDTYAIKGSAEDDIVKLGSGNIINGKINLAEGNDTIVISDNIILNGNVDLGAGENKLVFGELKNNKKSSVANLLSLRTASEENSYENRESTNGIIFNSTLENVNEIDVNKNTEIGINSKITGVKKIKISDDSKLTYTFIDKKNQPFADLADKDLFVEVKGKKKVELNPIGDEVQIGKEKDILGFEFRGEKNENLVDSNPEKIEVDKKETNTQPQKTEVDKKETNTQPQKTEVDKKETNTQPQKTEIDKKETNTQPQKTEVDKKETNTQLQKTEVTNTDNKGNNKEDNFFVDPRLGNLEKYSNGALNAYINDLKGNSFDYLKEYKKSKELFVNYLYNVTNNNPIIYFKELGVDSALAYHRANNVEFLEKNKIKVEAENYNIKRNYNSDNSYSSNGMIAKLNYGLTENINIGVNLGGANGKLRSFEDVKIQSTFIGGDILFKANNLVWQNSLSYGSVKPKDYKALNLESFYSKLEYDLKLMNNWSIKPQISLLATRVEQKETVAKNEDIKIKKKIQPYFETNTGIDVSKKFIKDRHQFTVSGGIDYSIAKDLENSKATFVGGTNEFELKNYNRKNMLSEVIKIDYKNLNGISTSLKYRRSNKNRSIGFNIGYIF